MGFNNNNQRRDNRNFNDRNRNNNNRQKRPKVSPKNTDPMGTPQHMQRHAMKIIRDIAFGKFDIGVEGKVFLYPGFIDQALIGVAIESQKSYYKFMALQTAYAGNQDPTILQATREEQKRYDAYQIVYNTLLLIKQYNDPQFLLGLVNQLPVFKYYL